MFTWFGRARAWYLSLPRFQFEAMTLGLAVLVGLLVMPVLIYIAGYATLKPYANGGLFALYVDWFKGLVSPAPSFWVVVAGPFAFLTFFRCCRWLVRKV